MGSGGSTGADKTIIVDLDGAIKTIEASKQANVKHYIMVSTYDARRSIRSKRWFKTIYNC